MPRHPNSSTDEIIVATLQLIAQHDVSGVTIDMVAEKAGVSKATLYRRWPSRADLMLKALSFVATPEVNPDTGSLRDDLAILLGELVRVLNQPDNGRIFAALTNASIRDPKLEALRQQIIRKARGEYESVIERAISRGELAPRAPVARLIDMLISPFICRRLVDHLPVRSSEVRPIVEMALASLLLPPAAKNAPRRARLTASGEPQ